MPRQNRYGQGTPLTRPARFQLADGAAHQIGGGGLLLGGPVEELEAGQEAVRHLLSPEHLHGAQGTACGCPPATIRRHLAQIGGALLDRLDLQVEIPSVIARELTGTGETSATVAARVAAARLLRAERREPAAFEPACQSLLTTAIARLGLSARAVTRAQQVARTIADLAGSSQVRTAHLAEAIQYRACGSLARDHSGRFAPANLD